MSFSKTVLLVGVHLPSPRVAVGASRQPFTSRSCLPPEACKLLYGAKWVSAQKIPVLLFYLTKILFSEVFKTAHSLALILPLITSLQEVSLLCERLNCKIPERSLSPSPYWRSGETKAQTGVAQSISGHVGTAAKTPSTSVQFFSTFMPAVLHLPMLHPPSFHIPPTSSKFFLTLTHFAHLLWAWHSARHWGCSGEQSRYRPHFHGVHSIVGEGELKQNNPI